MAELTRRKDITIEELEESLGAKKLPEFITRCESAFLENIDSIIGDFLSNPSKRAVFVSGPTSSGKTTFTIRLSEGLKAMGREAAFLSLDDYYIMKELTFDRDGRPDFETIDSIDVDRAARDISRIIAGERVVPPYFDFMTRIPAERDDSEAIELSENGVLVVEGLHGLSERIAGQIDPDKCLKVFIMPYGNVYGDTKIMDSNEIRLLRRIVRDNRHRGAHAIATVDYWPMIEKSEEIYYKDYLSMADEHINSFLPYESLIIAPLALGDIEDALQMAAKGELEPNIFMDKSLTGKPFADLSAALDRCARLKRHLEKIPVIDQDWIPDRSILNEFISK